MKLLCSLFLAFAICSTILAQEITQAYELVKMGPEINTHYHEAAPIVSPDGNTLYIFVHNHPDNTYGKDGSQDIWMSKKGADGSWSKVQHLGSPFNQHHSNQVFTVFPDGTLFIRGGKSKNSKGFSLVSPGGGLTELDVKDFSKMNNGRFYGAYLSRDFQNMLIYMSEKKDATFSDLYLSRRESNGSYSSPQKLKINHSLDDIAPFILPDQKTMYYSSGRPGDGRQGGLDIYKTTRLDDTWLNWSPPVNMGPVINTAAMDAYISMDDAGNIFTSRSNSRVDGGNLDIFMLVPKEIKVTLIGNVYNDKTSQLLPNATVSLTIPDKEVMQFLTKQEGKFETKFNAVSSYKIATTASGFLPANVNGTIPELVNDTTIIVDIRLTPIAKDLILTGVTRDEKTDNPVNAKIAITPSGSKQGAAKQTQNGAYEEKIPKLGWYTLTASASGYLNKTDSVELIDADLSPFAKDVYLQPIEIGVTVRLKNIYFDFDKTTLKSESFVELNKVVEFLKNNPTVEIEISGHTDSKGADDYNLNLSQGRSETVVQYLIDQGIETYRLTPRGYGEEKPIDTNDTDAGRANNRRVEFTVLKK